jgi:hypothetical protein
MAERPAPRRCNVRFNGCPLRLLVPTPDHVLERQQAPPQQCQARLDRAIHSSEQLDRTGGGRAGG